MALDEEYSSDWVESDIDDSSGFKMKKNIKTEVSSDDERPSIKRERLEEIHFHTYRPFGDPTEDNAKKETNKLLEEYTKQHPKLTDVTVAAIDDITSDDEIWTMQCPVGFDVKTLVDLPLLENGKKRTKIPNTKYECVSIQRDQNSGISVLLPPSTKSKSRILNCEVQGKFIVREKCGNLSDYIVNEREKSKVPFPANLKVRHPLFGNNYQEYIQLSASPKNQLEYIQRKRLRRSQKVKTSEKKIIHHEDDKRKAFKRKIDNEPVSARKNTKINHIWESEVSIEKCLFESPVSKKRKLK